MVHFYKFFFLSILFLGVAQVSPASDVVVFKETAEYVYRIPALVTAGNGDLLAFCERRTGRADHSANDIVLRRSTDNGKTWLAMQIIAERGGDSLNDPAIIVLDSGEVLLMHQQFPEGYHSLTKDHYQMAERGFGGPRNTRTLLLRSFDHGATWGDALDISKSARRHDAINIASPGRGIQLVHGDHPGRLLFPLFENHSSDTKRIWKTSVMISDDAGKTWRLGQPVPEDGFPGQGNENQIVELKDGAILMSSRNQSGEKKRRLTVSHDSGETWAGYRIAPDLVTLQCMGSIIRHGDVLVHSLPNSEKGRKNGAILVSSDEGQSWKRVYTITPGAFAYSSLTELEDGTVACLYEADGYESIRLAHIPEEALKGKATPAK